MNAFYVTVSIPLLLILVGFNHAHGLTTFGKSTNTNTQINPQQTAAQGKSCTSQANCNLIKGTTCIGNLCLCGDNRNPINGICKAGPKGAKHLCATDEDCVTGAECLPPKNKNKTAEGIDKVCTCQEGLYELSSGLCSGSANLIVLPGLILIIAILSRTIN